MSDSTRESEPAPAPGGIAAGAEFAGHTIVAEVGRGGMGVVYRVHDPILDRDRAMKVIVPALSSDPGFRERFRRESRLAAQVEHPNVIPIYRAGEEAGRLFLVMRLVEGADLRSIVSDEGPLAPACAARVLAAVAAALDAAHARGLVHRDVKPANVLIEPAPDGERVFLTDFGITRSEGLGGTITSSAQILGSVDYISPEQIAGAPLDLRADVYALGCVLYFALTGEPPFPREGDLARLYAHANAPRPKPSSTVPGLPAEVDEVVAHALAVAPVDRYASAGALAADFASTIESMADSETPRLGGRRPERESSEVTTDRLRRRPGRRALALTGAIALVAIAVAAVIVVGAGGGSNSPGPKVVATVPAGRGPNGLSIGPNLIWVAARASGQLVPIDPRSNRRAGPRVNIGGHPSAVAIAYGSLWATDATGNQLIQIRNHTIVNRIDVGNHPSDVIAANGWVWVANEGSNTVVRINPFTDPPTRRGTVHVGDGPRALAIGDGAVWVTNIDDGTVSKINPSHATTVGKPVPAGQRPSDVAAGKDAIWVVDNFNGTLYKIDPKTLAASPPLEVGDKPRGIKQGLGYLWVANGGDDDVWRLDQQTGRQVGDPIKVGNDPADVAIGDGSVWTANYDSNNVSRIRR